MTIICYDQKMLSADSLTSSAGTTVYLRSKLKITRQAAIISCGRTEDGFRFEEYYRTQSKEIFKAGDADFCVTIMTKDDMNHLYTDDSGSNTLISERALSKLTLGSSGASAYADALMREAKFNAHKACELAALYDRYCGLPVYSITQKQLLEIDPDFDGFWIGTYKTPLNKIQDYLITYKQWLKT